MIPQKVIKNYCLRIWHLFPLFCGLFVYGICGYRFYYFDFLQIFPIVVSSSTIVIMATDEWIRKKVNNSWGRIGLISMLVFVVIHGVCSVLNIYLFWCQEWEGTFSSFFTGYMWNEVLITPIWLVLVSNIMVLWLSKISKNHPLLAWIGWLISLIIMYWICRLFGACGIFDHTTLYTFADYCEFALVLFMVAAFTVSCWMMKKGCGESCTK